MVDYRKGKISIITVIFALLIGSQLGLVEGKVLLYDDFWNLSLSNKRHGGPYDPIWEMVECPLPQPEDDGNGNIVIKASRISMRTGKANWKNYGAEINFRLLPDTGNEFFRLTFGIRCDDTFAKGSYSASLEYDYKDGLAVRIWNGDNKRFERIILGGTPLAVLGSSWHYFRVNIIGESLTVYLDNIEIGSIKANQISSQGGISLEWESESSDATKAVGEIASVKVTEINPSPDNSVFQIDKESMRNLWYLETIGRNLALGKRCAFSPEPNYPLTKSERDPWDLTDGNLACQTRLDDRIWWDKGSVGWMTIPFAYITIDLEEEKSIDKVVLRTLGGKEQSMLSFPKKVQILLSTDGENFYDASEWQKTQPGDDSGFVFLPEEGRHYIYPLSLKCNNRSARYVVIKFEPEGFLFLDEIAVIEGSYPSVPISDGVERIPFKLDSAMLWSEVDTLWVCNNMPIFDRVLFADIRNMPSKVTLIFELPQGVELTKIYSGGKEIASLYKRVAIENKVFNQYEVQLHNPKPYEALRVWLTTSWESGTHGEAFLYTRWEGGQQERVVTPVYAFSIESIEPPKRLHTSIAWMVESFQKDWPNFFSTYKNLGFNTVPFFPRYGIQSDWLKQARDLGFSILYNESPMHVMANTFKNKEEIYVLYEDGLRDTQVSLAYRGQYYLHEMQRVEQLSEALKPDWVFFDLELFSSYVPIAGEDQQLLQRMNAEQWNSVSEACIMLGTEMLTDLTTAAKRWAADGIPPQVGFYNVTPERLYSDIYDFRRMYPQVLNIAQPSQYFGGDAARVGDQIKTIRKMLPQSDIIPWLTAGTYGEFPAINMRDMVLEAFFNGSCGITFYAISDFNGLDLKYTSEAIAIAAKVEDIIMDGHLIGDEELMVQDENVRVTGLKKANGDAAILVSNYASNDEMVVPVNYSVSNESNVIDLDNDTIIGTITPEIGTFFVKLSPHIRSRAVVIKSIK